MSNYELIAAPNSVEICRKVSKKVAQGYIPVGGVIINNNSNISRFMQAVYLPRECRRVYMHNGKEIPFSEYMKQTIKEALNEESKA